jgi:hypothetical protein
MFQFGLFSTFIPYLLISICYIGFLGSNALSKNQFLYQTNIVSQYEISFSDEYSEISTDNQTDNTNSSDSKLFLKYQDLIYLGIQKNPWELRNKKIHSLLLSSFILSRPPPSLV